MPSCRLSDRKEPVERVRPAPVAQASGALFAGVAVFQLALAAGAPWGSMAWGGVHPGVLPAPLRVASAGSSVGFAALAHALGRRRLTPGVRGRVTAGALGLSVVSAALNAASASAQERAIWTPFALTQIALLVAARRQQGPRHRVGALG